MNNSSEPGRQRSAIRALEEARYGSDGLLNLRDSMPTEAEAVARAESWLRERQVRGLAETLIITGRGLGSPGGVGVVKEGVRNLLGLLKRRGVVASFSENGPGSFLVILAPLTALFESPRRHKDRKHLSPDPVVPASLKLLDPELLGLIRVLAEASLTALGVSDRASFLESEMVRQFSTLAASLPRDVADRDARLREALKRAVREYEEE